MTGGTRNGPRSWIRHHHCGSLDGPVGNSSSQQTYSPIQGPRRWRIVDQLSFQMDQSITWPEMSWNIATTRSSLAYCLSLLKNNISQSYSSSSLNKGNRHRDLILLAEILRFNFSGFSLDSVLLVFGNVVENCLVYLMYYIFFFQN